MFTIASILTSLFWLLRYRQGTVIATLYLRGQDPALPSKPARYGRVSFGRAGS